MSISPATWPRALRSNSLLGLLLVLLAAAPATAQQAERLILDRGPFRERGLPFLVDDTTPLFRGRYLLGGETVEIYYLRDGRPEGLDGEEWEPAPCGEGVTVRSFPRFGTVHARTVGGGGELLYLFPAGIDPCNTAAAFERRFSYFLGTTPDWYLPPFPAVVEL